MTEEEFQRYNDASVDMAVSFEHLGIMALIFLGIFAIIAVVEYVVKRKRFHR